MCETLTAAIQSHDKHVSYDPTEIEQIILEGNIAIVRLIWTETITDKSNSTSTVVKEKDEMFSSDKVTVVGK